MESLSTSERADSARPLACFRRSVRRDKKAHDLMLPEFRDSRVPVFMVKLVLAEAEHLHAAVANGKPLPQELIPITPTPALLPEARLVEVLARELTSSAPGRLSPSPTSNPASTAAHHTN